MATHPPTSRSRRPSEPAPDDFVARVAWGVAHDAFLAPEVHAMLRLWEAGDDSPHVRRVLDEAVQLCARAVALRTTPPFRVPQGLTHGSLRFSLVQGGEVFMPASTLTTGLLVVGPTGTGKTTALRYLAESLADDPTVHVTVVDCAKNEHRSLLPLYNARGRELAVLRPKDLPLNLVWPAGLTAEQANATMPGVYARLLRIEAGTEVVLRETFDAALRPGRRPSLLDLYGAALQVASAFPLAKASLESKLRPLCREALPTLARTREPAPIAAWRTANTVLELGGLSETLRALVLICLLQGLFRGGPTGGVHFVFVDDAARVLALDALIEGLGPISELVGVVRARGVAFGVGAQSWVGVAPSLAANLNTKLILGIGSGHDMVRVAGDLQLRPEQIEAVRHLGQGEAILQLPPHVWPEPVLVAIPDVPAVPVDDATAARSADLVRRWPRTVATEYATDWSPPPLGSMGRSAGHAVPDPRGRTDAAAERRFLEAVLAFPNLAASELARKAGLKDSRAIAIRHALVGRGWLRVHKVQRTARGRASQVLEVTAEGLRALRGQGNARLADTTGQGNARVQGDAGQTSP